MIYALPIFRPASISAIPIICFINEKPVKREIIAANFRDRVGKGTDFGINRDILYQLIVEGLCKARWRSVPDRDLCQFLYEPKTTR